MKRRSRKRLLLIGIPLIVVLVVAVFLSQRGKGDDSGPRTVKVERRTIVDKALAVGSIEPLNEIAVKSKISGVVGRLFVDVGDLVQKGDPVLEVKPDPTPIELAEAKRNLEMSHIELNTLRRELDRNEEMKKKNLISDYDYEVLRQQYDEAELRTKIAEERLDLIEKGKITIAETQIESIIKSPITGFILEKNVNVGDPVVPLTSYQAGTEILKMANMENLIFKGTVDEIDVGKIREGLRAELQIGALPGQEVIGHVSLISLKARKEENTTVFPVEIIIDDRGDAVLRAGFSANANIIIAQKDSVLSIPERVVTFRNDSAFVQIPTGEKTSEERVITTGLSDAIYIEVLSGLEKDQDVLEKEVKEII